MIVLSKEEVRERLREIGIDPDDLLAATETDRKALEIVNAFYPYYAMMVEDRERWMGGYRRMFSCARQLYVALALRDRMLRELLSGEPDLLAKIPGMPREPHQERWP